ncbi:MAG: hypothetical protein R3321_08835 [Nitrososphaeraceae archaeon]|nr:hypothetical protein [Nitrososphaeraceae archaeon]
MKKIINSYLFIAQVLIKHGYNADHYINEALRLDDINNYYKQDYKNAA